MALLIVLSSIDSIAQITASQTEGCAPLIGVNFTHNYNGATGVLWSFGNGGSSTNNNPTTTFQQPGVYNVTFTANGGIQSNITVTVSASPQASFEIITESTGCLPLNVSFQDNSTPGVGATLSNWSWDFGDGGVSNGSDANPSHLYTLIGVNDVTLVVEDNNGCEGSFSMQDAIVTSIPPTLSLMSNPANTSACNPPLTINFSAEASSNSPLSDNLDYAWNLGAAGSSTSTTPPAQTYTENGTYPVSIVVTDDAGCSSNSSDNVFIGSPEAEWNLIGGPSFCDTVYFENLSDPANTSISWGDGSTLNTFTPQDTLRHVYLDAGTYTATITTSSPGCSSVDDVTFSVDEIIADFVSTPNFSCNPTLTTSYTSTSTGAEAYTWIFGSDTISSVSETDYTHQSQAAIDPFLAGGAQLFGAWLYVTSGAGCRDSVEILNDTIWVPTAAFAVDVSEGCRPLTVTFADSSSAQSEIISWEWHTGDGSILNSEDEDETPEYIYTVAGDYESYLIITTEEGCSDTSFVIPINVGDEISPQADFGPLVVCPGETVDLEAIIPSNDETDLWSIQTDGMQMSGCPQSSSVSGGFDSYAGMHNVTIFSSYNGCLSSHTYTNAIEVLGPIGHFHGVYDCSTPYDITLEASISGADTWTFDFGDGSSISSSTEQIVEHTYSAVGDYTVSLTSYGSDGCGPYVEEDIIRIRDVSAILTPIPSLCADEEISLSASQSQDVYAACHEGYLWIFDQALGLPPIRSDIPFTSIEPENSGVYEILLVTQDINGCSDTTAMDISVYDVNAAIDFEADGECLPMNVNFFDASSADTTLASWQWNFGGFDNSNTTNPNYTFTTSNNPPFTVSLFVTDIYGCSDTASVTINPDLPNADFSSTNPDLCAGDDITLSALNSNYPYYEWNLGNGDAGNENQVSTEYLSSGAYDVMLIVQNEAGCFDTTMITSYVEVQDYPNVGFSSSADGLENLCYPILIEFTDTTGADIFEYLDWNLGTGFPVVDNTSVGTIYEAPGTYTVSLEVGTTFGCVSNYSKTIIVEGPVADFVLSTDEICLYDAVTMQLTDTSDVSYFMWDFGNGVDSAMVDPVTYNYNQIPTAGATNIQLITWSADSVCSATTEVPFQVNITTADFERNNEVAFEDTVHCFGLPDHLTQISSEANYYQWNLGNGTTRTAPQFTYYYPEGGMYDITLIASNTITGCSDTITKGLTIYPEMNVSAENGLACDGDTIFLSAYGGESYVWEPQTYVNDAFSQFPYVTYSQNSELYVTVTDTNECSKTVSLIAEYIYAPPAPVWADTTINFGTPLFIDFPSEPYHIYDWSSTMASNCQNCGTPYLYSSVDDTFMLVVSDELNCTTDTFYWNVTVLSDMLFYMPNAFSPNEDGFNDLFHPVVTRARKEDYFFGVWDRYGELVWETSDINGKWNGEVNNGLYYGDSQVYIWKVIIQDLKAINHSFTGSVTVIR